MFGSVKSVWPPEASSVKKKLLTKVNSPSLQDLDESEPCTDSQRCDARCTITFSFTYLWRSRNLKSCTLFVWLSWLKNVLHAYFFLIQLMLLCCIVFFSNPTVFKVEQNSYVERLFLCSLTKHVGVKSIAPRGKKWVELFSSWNGIKRCQSVAALSD